MSDQFYIKLQYKNILKPFKIIGGTLTLHNDVNYSGVVGSLNINNIPEIPNWIGVSENNDFYIYVKFIYQYNNIVYGFGTFNENIKSFYLSPCSNIRLNPILTSLKSDTIDDTKSDTIDDTKSDTIDDTKSDTKSDTIDDTKSDTIDDTKSDTKKN